MAIVSGDIAGFASQLQDMELTVSRVLMETALKLAAMADVSVFVLVEHSSGVRLFSGKRHLCDAYSTSNLSPTESDVEMEINPEVSALQQRFVEESFQQQQQLQQPPQRLTPLKTAYRVRSRSSLKRSHTASSSNTMKRLRHFGNSTDNSMSIDTKPSVSYRGSSRDFRCDDIVTIADDGFEANCNGKDSVPNIDAKSEDGYEDDVICEGEENYADVFTSPAAASRIACGNTVEHERSPLGINVDDDELGGMEMSGAKRTAAMTRGLEDSATILSYPDKEWIFSEILSHPKLEAVKRICDVESVADKNSVPSKILNSLLYDFAKSAAAKCPFRNAEDARCKQFYAECFEEIWNGFLPNLRALDERDSAVKKMTTTATAITASTMGRDRSIRTCCRDLFRRNFFTLVRRQNKRGS